MNISLAQKHHELNIACAQQLAEILRDVDLTIDDRSYKTTAGGDERKLRGIPAIGRNVAGCINGLRPGDDAKRATAYVTNIR